MNRAGSRFRLAFAALLLCVVIASAALFALSYRYDNKYTWDAAAGTGKGGVLRLNRAAYADSPLLFLADGWEFYQYKALTPEEIPEHQPDAYLFIGQYGGFELGNPEKSPHGSSTYRLTVFADDQPRDYAMELPEIFSTYRVWVNGEPKAESGSVGADTDGYRPLTSNTIISFTAAGKIEIVVAVADYTHFYSGMVYPPAFGSPQAVYRLLIQRHLFYGAVCGVALLIGILCLLLGAWQRKIRRARGVGPLALLCLCFAGYASHPVVHSMGLAGEIWYDIELVSYYAMFLAAILLQGALCDIPKKVYLPASALSGLVCLSVPLYRHLGMNTAAGMYRFSAFLSAYIVLAGAYLLVCAVLAVIRGETGSKALLCGFCVFGTALLFDELFPWFEPVRFGWQNETAGFILILIIGGVVCGEAARAFRESHILREREQAADILLQATRDRMRMQEEYAGQMGRFIHDAKNRLLTARTHIKDREYGELERYIDGQLGELADFSLKIWTGHKLIDTFLSSAFARAEAVEIRTECETGGVPEYTGVDDRDLASLFTNLLDNALEACGRMEPGADRWIRLKIHFQSAAFIIHCVNSCDNGIELSDGRPVSSKGAGHGYGLQILGEIAERYGGGMELTAGGGEFRAYMVLHPDISEEE